MPDQDFETVDLLQPTSRVYATQYSLMHGPETCEETTDLFAFQALFFEQIIIPDSYIHCYGPMFTLITQGLDRPKDLRTRAQRLLLGLLESGVIVPAYRERLSSYENWDVVCEPRANFLWLRKDDAERLKSFDFINRARALWPARGDFSADLLKVLAANREGDGLLSKECLRMSLNPLGDCEQGMSLVDEIHDFCERRKRGGLRVLSGDIELIIEKALDRSGAAAEDNIYKRAQLLRGKRKSPLEAVALQMLYLVKGTSEDLFARTFNADGWKLPDQLTHLQTLYRQKTSGCKEGSVVWSLLAEILSLRNLTCEDILEIRQTPAWMMYRASFTALRAAEPSEKQPDEFYDELHNFPRETPSPDYWALRKNL
jgi:hypothetical protein